MNALIIGCGSIGRRRAKVLAEAGHRVMLYDTDTDRARSAYHAISHGNVSMYIGGNLASGWGDGEPAYDVALICTPPDSGRPEQIQRCLEMGVRGLYVEKPLALDLSDVDEIRYVTERLYKNGEDITTMGACNLRFAGVAGLKKIPRPWRMARLTMRQGAKYWSPTHRPISLILDSIHELDLAVYLQGPIESIRGYSEPDSAEVSVHHEGGGLSHIFLDRVTSPPVREVQVIRKGDYDSLAIQTKDSMYVREMEHFMECLEKGVQTCNTLRAAAEVCAAALEVA